MTLTVHRGEYATLHLKVDGSVRQELNGQETCSVTFDSVQTVDLDLGDWITVFNKRYTLNILPQIVKKGPRLYSYACTFESVQYDLRKVQFRDGRTGDFPLTGNLSFFVNQIVVNLNRISTGWTSGTIKQDTADKTLPFMNENCLEVLQRLCTEYEVDFKISEDKEISVDNFTQSAVQSFSYGKGNGLYELTRKTVDSKDIITRLYPEGGQRNLPANYRDYSNKLKIDGDYIDQNTGKYGIIEWTQPFEDIYPRFTGAITAVDTDVTKFTCSDIDFDVNDQLMPGMSAKVHFNSGSLAGYEFELISYVHATKTITLKKLDQEKSVNNSGTLESYQLPSDALKPAVGDRFVFLDIIMPQSYIDAAEAELLTKAQEYLGQNSEPRIAYSLSIDPKYIKDNLITLSKGDYVNVKDTDLRVDKNIRITALTRKLGSGNEYEIELSDSLSPQKFSRVVSDVEDIKRLVVVNRLNDISRAKRSFRNTDELKNMVFDSDGYFDPTNIKPLSIETNMLSVGSKAGYFTLSSLIEPNYQASALKVKLGAGVLTHFTISDTPKTWNLSENIVTDLVDASAYYIYAKCSRSSNSGQLVVDSAQRLVDSDPTYFYFLVGDLHSVDGGVRDISRTYGRSTTNGKFIKGVLTSDDGLSYIDLNSGEFAGKFTFRSGKTDQEVEDIATGANSKIDGLQIGGRNLLLNSQDYCDFSNTDYSSSVELRKGFIRPVSDDLFDCYKMWMPFLSGLQYKGKTFTISIDVKISWYNVATIVFWVNFRSPLLTAINREISISEFSINSGWKRISCTLEVPDDYSCETPQGLCGFKGSGLYNTIIEYKDLKCEYGNKATDWTPAPEDVYIDATAKAIAAQTAAQEYALAKANLAAETAAAYADGIVTTEEQRAIDDATAKANAAQAAAISAAATDATAKADAAKAAAIQEMANTKNYVDNVLPETLSGLQNQIDGQIESFFYSYDPTLSNVPAVDWGTVTGKEKHLNDTFTNNLTGASWKFTKSGEVYSWVEIADTATKEALRIAGLAKDTADAKRRVFVSQPSTPYEIGDLWSQGSSGELMKCVYSRLSGSYTISDWGKASKYTDDTTALTAQQRAIEAEQTAKAYAEAKANLAAETAQAYADGIVTEEEQRAIDDATAKANAAQTAAISAAAADATFKTNNIQIGGRNLLLNSAMFELFGADFPQKTSQSVVVVNGIKEDKLTTVAADNLAYKYTYPVLNFIPESGIDYVLSFEYRTTAEGAKFHFDARDSSHTNLLPFELSVPNTGGEWKKGYIVCNFQITNQTITLFQVTATQTVGAEITYRKLKFEKGNKATDWTPATEDVDASISAAMAKAQESDYLKTAIQGAVEVDGGLELVNLLLTKNAQGEITGGMSGDSSDNVGIFTGGTYAQAIANTAKNILYKNGAFRLAGGDVTYDIASLALTISALIRTAITGERVEISKENNSITIYDADNVPKMKFAPKNVLPFADISSNTTTVTTTYADHSGTLDEAGSVNIESTETLVLDPAKFYDITTPNVSYSIAASGNYDGGTKTHYFASAGISVQLVDTIRNTVVWTRNKTVSSSSTTASTDSGIIEATTLKAQKGSTYRIDVFIGVDLESYCVGSGSASIAAGQTLSGVTLASFSEIGLNGVNFINDATHFLHYGSDGLAYKGVSDMPGVLASGSVSSVAGHSNKWGAKVGTDSQSITKGGTGIYNVPHNLGSAVFTIITTPTTDNINIRVTGKTTNTFQVTCKNMSGTATDAGFDYVMIGNN